MTKPLFIAMGDTHIDKYVWRTRRFVEYDSFVAFAAIVDLSIEYYVPLVLVGDIFDSVDPGSEEVKFFREQMDRCQDESIPVFVMQGNHDRREVPWGGAIHKWPVYIGHGKEFVIGDKRCVAFDYMPHTRIDAALIELGSRDTMPDILFMHQAVKQVLGFEGKYNCDLEMIPADIPLVVLSDIHKEWSSEFRHGQTAVYTGSSHFRDKGQFGPKSCLLVNDDLSFSRLPIPYRDVEVSSCLTADSVRELRVAIDKLVSKKPILLPLVLLSFLDTLSEDVSKLLSDYSGKVIFVTQSYSIEDDLNMEAEIDTRIEKTRDLSMSDMLNVLVNSKEEPQVHSMALALLSGDAIQDTINQFRTLVKEE